MKIAVILLTVSLLCILNVATADSHSHHPQTVEHHVVKHATHAEGHDSSKKGIHHDEHKHVKKLGKSHHHDEEKAHKENKAAVKHQTEDVEKGGKKSEHHEIDHHQSHKRAGAVAQHGAKHKQSAKEKKLHYSKGFREQFHKDEHKKHDSFYSNDKKSGEYHVYGGKDHKYHSNHYSKDSHGKYVAGKSSDQHGTSGKKANNHKNSVKKGYQHESGNTKQYAKHNKWAKSNLKTAKAH